MELIKKSIIAFLGMIILLIAYNKANGIIDYRCDVNCTNNSLKNLHILKDTICDFVSLRIYNFSQDSINKLLDSLKYIKNKVNLTDLEKIETIYLQSLYLDSLPIVSKLGCIYNYNDENNMFPRVKRITFHDCEIRIIGGLGSKELIELDIYNSFYSGLPKGIEDMKNLINLSISWENEVLYKEKFPNEFIDLDISLRRFTKGDNLTSLHILYHQFDTIPDYIMYLTNIRYLKIEGKKLITLPQYLENHKSLYYIDISDWGLVELPDWIFSSKKKYLLELNKEQKEKNWDKIQQSTNLTIKYYSRVIKRAD